MALLDIKTITQSVAIPKYSLNAIQPSRFNLYVEAMNDAIIPIRNASMMRGMIYDFIGNINPHIAHALHSDHSEKPWTFSDIRWNNCVPQTQKGMYAVKKGTIGQWTFNTIDPILSQVLFESFKTKILHFGTMELRVKGFHFEDHTYYSMPEDWSNITIHFHTPFYRTNTKFGERFDINQFIDMQLHKLQHFKLIENADPSSILPYIHVIRDDSEKSVMNLTDQIPIIGRMGDITLKIFGDDDIKETVFTLLYLSQFIGCGSRSSMGYGHIELIKVV